MIAFGLSTGKGTAGGIAAAGAGDAAGTSLWSSPPAGAGVTAVLAEITVVTPTVPNLAVEMGRNRNGGVPLPPREGLPAGAEGDDWPALLDLLVFEPLSKRPR